MTKKTFDFLTFSGVKEMKGLHSNSPVIAKWFENFLAPYIFDILVLEINWLKYYVEAWGKVKCWQ